MGLAIEQDGLTDTIKTEKALLVGSRHSGSRLKGRVDEIEVYDRQLSGEEAKRLAENAAIETLLAIDPEKRTDEQNQSIRRFYLTNQNAAYQQVSKELAKVNKKLESLRKPMTSVMIMGDMQDPRETFILDRGSYDSPTGWERRIGCSRRTIR